MSTGLNVLVYNGSGVSAASRDNTLVALRSFLGHRYDVQLVSPKTIRDEPWEASCALLVFPGGRDLPYQFDLAGKANARIRSWVEEGGRYLGFCAGAYYASGAVEFELGTPLEVTGERELGFFPGVCRGTVFPGFEYGTGAGAREASLLLDRTAWRDHWSASPDDATIWYNGGGAFHLREGQTGKGVTVLARYAEVPDKPAAGVRCDVGRGRAVLWATHPEHPAVPDAPTSIDSNGPMRVLDYPTKETRRLGLLRATLAMLELDVADTPAPPPQLMPLFLTAAHPAAVLAVAQSIAALGTTSEDAVDAVDVLEKHDRFRLHPASAATALVKQARAQPGTADPDELHAAIKHICACTEGLPGLDVAPLFNLEKYYAELRRVNGEREPAFGRVIMYGEAVTSTQTMLDQNDKFLSSLPAGLVCMASHQIAGRGRGGNSWVSPAGCLQHSLVVRLDSTHSSKIVFLQYLYGLAVVEAIRTCPGYEQVGVVLKWPNDIYGDLGRAAGEGFERYRKIGGILVNSSFAGDSFNVVVGCGVNTSNPKPTTSVNELVALHNYIHRTNLAPFGPETLLALILAQLDKMWLTFIEKGFEPFLDQYLTRWIHSDQRVTIKETNQRVRIVGITPDHGMLRTVQVDVDRYGNEVFSGGMGEPKFIDLQPDGNRFNMLEGLLSTKA